MADGTDGTYNEARVLRVSGPARHWRCHGRSCSGVAAELQRSCGTVGVTVLSVAGTVGVTVLSVAGTVGVTVLSRLLQAWCVSPLLWDNDKPRPTINPAG